MSPNDQLSLKICQSCFGQVEDVYPIFEFCNNTTKLMSIIASNMKLEALKVTNTFYTMYYKQFLIT